MSCCCATCVARRRACPRVRPSGGSCTMGPTSFADAAGGAGRESWRATLPACASAVGCCGPGLGGGDPPVAIAIVVVILINAAFAFVQEMQAERAVEALAEYLPDRARVLRDGREQVLDADRLVPGDVLLIEEGDRIRQMPGLHRRGRGRPLHAERGIGPRLPGRRSSRTRACPGWRRVTWFSRVPPATVDPRGHRVRDRDATELGRIAALSERLGKEEARSRPRCGAWRG